MRSLKRFLRKASRCTRRATGSQRRLVKKAIATRKDALKANAPIVEDKPPQVSKPPRVRDSHRRQEEVQDSLIVKAMLEERQKEIKARELLRSETEKRIDRSGQTKLLLVNLLCELRSSEVPSHTRQFHLQLRLEVEEEFFDRLADAFYFQKGFQKKMTKVTRQLIADFLLARKRAERFVSFMPELKEDLAQYKTWLSSNFVASNLLEVGLNATFDKLLTEARKHLVGVLYYASCSDDFPICDYETATAGPTKLTTASLSREFIRRLEQDKTFIPKLRDQCKIYFRKGDVAGLVWPKSS